MHLVNLKSLDKPAVFHAVEQWGLPRYRGAQLIRWLYAKGATSIDEITEFSKELRKFLSDVSYIGNLRLVGRAKSFDNTEKFLFALEDNQNIESVLIPEGNRLTLCISSQVGCALGCLFCRTGRYGLVRSLRSDEIVDQVVAVNRIIKPAQVSNIVLMGMGEPLANFDEVVDALWRITEFLGISKRKITLSTAGIVPKILLLPRKAPDINIAISLNATTDEVRNEIMPVNRRYPISSLINACRKYPLQPGRRITIEYVMIDDKNDSREDASRLVNLLSGMRSKVNLIQLNPYPGSALKKSPEDKIIAFQEILLRHRVRAFIRESRGQDILAACGQLRADNEIRGKEHEKRPKKLLASKSERY